MSMPSVQVRVSGEFACFTRPETIPCHYAVGRT